MGPKSSALCNAVTADPPFGLAGHYNPAGLHGTPEGKITVKMGAMAVLLSIEARYEPDNEYDGLLGHFKPEDDPLAYTSSKLDGMSLAAPFYTRYTQATLDVPAIAGPLGANSVSFRAPGSRWAFGLNYAYPIMAGGFYRKPGNPGRFMGTKTGLIHFIYLQPAASYKVTDTLSVGVAVGFGSSMFIQNLDVRATNDMTALTKLLGDATRKLEIPVWSQLTMPPPWMGGGVHPWKKSAGQTQFLSDDFTPHFNLGLLWEPKPWFAFGVCYNSAIKAELNGWLEFEYGNEIRSMIDWFGSSPLLLIGAGMFDLPYKSRPTQKALAYSNRDFPPQRLNIGFKVKPTKNLTLTADFRWCNWSQWQHLFYYLDQDIDAMKLVKLTGYAYPPNVVHVGLAATDDWNPSFGLQYQLTERHALRLGYEFRPVSIPYDHQGPVQMPDLHNFGLGFEIRDPNGARIELSFNYIFGKMTIPNNGSKNLNSTSFTDLVTPYAGLDADFKWKGYFFQFAKTIPFKHYF
jgi:long-subunit fatty acid transport protein